MIACREACEVSLISFPTTIPVTVSPIAWSTRADAKVIWVIVVRVIVWREPFSTRVTVLRRVSTVCVCVCVCVCVWCLLLLLLLCCACLLWCCC